MSCLSCIFNPTKKCIYPVGQNRARDSEKDESSNALLRHRSAHALPVKPGEYGSFHTAAARYKKPKKEQKDKESLATVKPQSIPGDSLQPSTGIASAIPVICLHETSLGSKRERDFMFQGSHGVFWCTVPFQTRALG